MLDRHWQRRVLKIALNWIALNSSVKGHPNMTAGDVRSYEISVFLPQVKFHHPQVPSSISERTAARWLHQLGFEPPSTKKRVYIDGHECSNVVEYKKLYLRKLEILMPHNHLSVMSLLPSHLITKSLSRFFTKKQHTIQTMIRKRCGLKNGSSWSGLKDKGGA